MVFCFKVKKTVLIICILKGAAPEFIKNRLIYLNRREIMALPEKSMKS